MKKFILLSWRNEQDTRPIFVELNINADNGQPPGPVGNWTKFLLLFELTKTETVPAYRPILLIFVTISSTIRAVLLKFSCLGSITKIKSDGVSQGAFWSKVVGLVRQISAKLI